MSENFTINDDISLPFTTEVVAFGDPYHGLVTNGILALPNGSTMPSPHPGGADVFILRVPDCPPLNFSPEKIAADAAEGKTWLDYVVLSGINKGFYGDSLGAQNKWIWAQSSTKKWIVEVVYNVETFVTIGTFQSPTLGAATLHMRITLTEAFNFYDTPHTPVVHSFLVSQTLSGQWSTNNSSPNGTTYPISRGVSLCDISMDGSKVIFAVPRAGFNYRTGVHGFFELEMTSTTSVSINVLADCVACNPPEASWYVGPSLHFPVWYWYNSNDVIEEVALDYSHTSGLATRTLAIQVDNVTKSLVLTDDSIYGGVAHIDSYNDSGRLAKMTNLQPVPINSLPLHLYDMRHFQGYFYVAYNDYYEGQWHIPDEAMQIATVRPYIYSNKTVGFEIAIYHVNSDYDIMVGDPATYLLGDKYYGRVVHPGGYEDGVVHCPVIGASFAGNITGTTLDVYSVSNGGIVVGMLVEGPGIQAGTYVTAFLTGSGGAGTYTVNNDHTPGVETYVFNGSGEDKIYTTYQPVTGEITRNSLYPVGYV